MGGREGERAGTVCRQARLTGFFVAPPVALRYIGASGPVAQQDRATDS